MSHSCDPTDCSLSGSSVGGISQARTLEWVGISFSRGIFPTQGIEPRSPALQADSLPTELPGIPYRNLGNPVFLACLSLSSWKNRDWGGDVLKEAHLFIMLPFLALSRHCVLYTLKVCVNSCQASLLAPFPQQHLVILCLYCTFW